MKLTHLVLGILGLLNLSSLGQATEEISLLPGNQATVTGMVREVETDDRYEDLRARTTRFITDWQAMPNETDRTELLEQFYRENISGRDRHRLSPALVYAYSNILPGLGLNFLEAYLEGSNVRRPQPLMLSGLTSSLLQGVEQREIFSIERTTGYAVSSSFVAVLACHAGLAQDLLTQRGINPLNKILKSECKDFFDLVAKAVPTLRTPEIEHSELKDCLVPLSEIQQHNPPTPDLELALPRRLLVG